MLTRRTFALGLAGLALVRPAAAGAYPIVMAYHDPGCGCCEKWADVMKQAGFQVMLHPEDDMASRKERLGVPQSLASCHTAVIGKYIIEGHVPPEDVKLFLAGQPSALGLAVPGMPQGSPGMEGGTPEPYDVIQFGRDGSQGVFAKHA